MLGLLILTLFVVVFIIIPLYLIFGGLFVFFGSTPQYVPEEGEDTQ